MLDQATMKLSVQIPKFENRDNRGPREIADITNCYTDRTGRGGIRGDGGRT